MENQKPLISCVVVIYNVTNFLAECIQSLVIQDYKNIEIILVNDGSTDDSLTICQAFARKDERIKIINQKNQGANCARNAGLREAKGEWVYFVDGDDYVTHDVFSYIEDYLYSENEIIMFSNYTFKNEKKSEKKYPISHIEFGKNDFFELILATMDRLGDSKYNYKYLDSVSIWNKCYKREFLISNNLEFIPRFPKCQDLTFNLKVYEKATKAVFVDHPGYVYRINSLSVSNRYQKDFLRKIDVMNKWFAEFVKKYMDNKRVISAYKSRILTFLRTSTILYFSNPHNPLSYRHRKKEFLEFLNKEPYNSICKTTEIRNLPIQERVLSWAIKTKNFWMIELLNILRRKVNL